MYVHEDDVAYERLVELAEVRAGEYGEELVVEVGAVPNGLYQRSTAGELLGPSGVVDPVGRPPQLEVVPTTHRWVGPLGGDPRDQHSRLDIVEAFDEWPTLIDVERWAEDYQQRAQQIVADLQPLIAEARDEWELDTRATILETVDLVEAALTDLREFVETFGESDVRRRRRV